LFVIGHRLPTYQKPLKTKSDKEFWLRRFNSRLRVASGLQALQRCSGLLNRRARGSTVAAHHAFMQKSAGFPCSEALPERYRLKAPISDRELG